MSEKRGMIHVYTGNGKGKTTAALGLAMRATGHGRKAIMIQFMKGDIEYGEIKAAVNLPDFTIEQFGRPSMVDKKNPAAVDVEWARKALQRAKDVIESGEYDIVILDEVNVAVDFNLIPLGAVLDIIEKRAPKTEIVLTGRYAKPELMKIADLVTEMLEIKHYYAYQNIEAREGIEY